MAKGQKFSFEDFSEDANLIDDETEEVEQTDEEQEDVEPQPPPAKKKKVAAEAPKPEEEPEPVKKKVAKKVEPEPEPEPEEETEEDETETEEEDETDEVNPEEQAKAFFEEVEKLTGTTLEIDYSGVDPLSPQGVALREKAVKEAALDSFLEEIKEKFPKVFEALEFSYSGGNVADLFTQTTGRDYSNVQLSDEDTGLAKEILKEYYKARGVKNEAKIAKMIEADEDSENGLIKEAQVALAELKEEQEAERAEILEAQKQKAAEQKKKDQILVTAVDEILENRKLGNFKIPDRAEAQEFKKFVVNSIRRTGDGKYELATPLDQANMEKILQYQYFQFKKGDLSKIIQQTATTKNAENLRLKLKQEQTKTKKTTTSSSTGKLSLNDFMSE